MKVDDDEFAEWYAAVKDDCYRAVLVSMPNADSPADLLAESFARAYASWTSVRVHPAPRAWVLRTALNLHRDSWRRTSRARLPERKVDFSCDEAPIDPVLVAALRELSERQRQVVVLRVILGSRLGRWQWSWESSRQRCRYIFAAAWRRFVPHRASRSISMKVSDPYDDVLVELDGDDERTVAQLRGALGSIEFDYPVDAVVALRPSSVGAMHRRRRYLAAAAVAAAVALGMVVTNFGAPTESIASAEWVPEPQAVDDVERAQIISACEAAARPPAERPVNTVIEIDDPGSDLAVPDLAVSPSFNRALIDRRGDIAAVVASTADVRLDCAVHFVNGEWYAFAAAVGWGGNSIDPSVGSAWSGDVEITMISGVAVEAASVEIDAPGLVSGTTPVIDGRYVLWIPSSSDWDDDTTVTVRQLDANGSEIGSVRLDVDAAPS